MIKDNHLIKDILSSKKPQVATEEVAEKFSDKMRNIGIKEKEREAKAKATLMGFQYIDLSGFPISPETLILFSEQIAKELEVICFFRGSNDIRLGAVEPKNSKLQEIIKKMKEADDAMTKEFEVASLKLLACWSHCDTAHKEAKKCKGQIYRGIIHGRRAVRVSANSN